MNINDHVKISKIAHQGNLKSLENYYSIVWIKDPIEGILIDDLLYKNISNNLFFLSPKHQWSIINWDGIDSKGYLLYLSDNIMNEPFLNRLQINEMRILHSDITYCIPILLNLGQRLQSIIEMLDELMTSNLNHREDAVLALINVFFVYCDGLCEEESRNSAHNGKSILVYKFTKLLNTKENEIQKVSQYAMKMNVSSTYLNECVHEILGISTKSLILMQLIARTKNALKFTDKSVKIIAYELGFSSPEYFSTFCKKHIGNSPTEYRKV